MKSNEKNINRKKLETEIEVAQNIADDLAKDIREITQSCQVGLQNIYDTANNERDLREKVDLHNFMTLRIKNIQTSIQTIEAGSHGICTDCQCEINERRLAAAPESMLCLSCQSEREIFGSTHELQKIRVIAMAA